MRSRSGDEDRGPSPQPQRPKGTPCTEDPDAFAQNIADELKPHYRALLKKAHKTEADAYSLAYGRAVAQVAKANRTTEAKAKFLFRDLLQSIMGRVTE